MQVGDVGVPLRLPGWLEPLQPSPPKRDVLNLVVVNGPHDVPPPRIPRLPKGRFELEGVVEIAPFEGERKTSEIVQHFGELLRLGPEVAIHRQAAEGDTQFSAPLGMQTGMSLFIAHDPRQPQAKLRRGLGKSPQDKGHHLERLQLMIGHDVMRDPPPTGLPQAQQVRHRGSLPGLAEAE